MGSGISTIGDRLKEERVRLAFNQTEFAALAKASKHSQIDWESGKAAPNATYLAAIASAGADVNYVVTGKRFSVTPTLMESAAPYDAKGLVYVPFYTELRASAGPGALIGSEETKEMIGFRPELLNKLFDVPPKFISLHQADGQSMEPDICHGEVLMVDRRKTSPGQGTYLIRIGDELMVKLLQRLPGGVVRVSSRNAALFKEFEVKLSTDENEFAVLGRVFCKWTSV